MIDRERLVALARVMNRLDELSREYQCMASRHFDEGKPYTARRLEGMAKAFGASSEMMRDVFESDLK